MFTHSMKGETWCGESIITPATMKPVRTPIGNTRVKNPTMAAQMSQIPAIEVTVTMTMSATLPCMRIAGEYTKRNGTMYELQPKGIAVQPVAMEGEPAMAAAT